MTQEIIQITDFQAIEDAIELWAATGSDLPQLQDAKKVDVPKVFWAGFDFDRKRPYGLLTIVSDLSPGQSCTDQEMVTVGAITSLQTVYSKLYVWNVQVQFFQDAYDINGDPIRVTARQYAKNLIDRYDIPPIRNILLAESIAFHPLGKNIRGDIADSQDEDKYIHQASVEFRFSGVNNIALRDTDYFTSITSPTEENGGITLSGA